MLADFKPSGIHVNRGRKGQGGKRWKPSSTPLTEPEKDLAAAWIGYAIKMSRKWSKDKEWLREDFESAALLALLDAARNYDPSNGATFFTYLGWHLRSAKKSVIQQNSILGYRSPKNRARAPRVSALDASFASTTGDEVSKSAETKDEIYRRIGRLPEPFATLIRSLYFSGMSMREIGRQWKWAPDKIREAHQIALRAMREDVPIAELEAESRRLGVPPSARFGAWMKTTRMKLGIGLRPLGRMLYVSHSYLHAIESGTKPPSPRICEAACFILGRGGNRPD